MIAAIAMTHGYAVFTDNPREFQRASDLSVQRPNWSLLG